MLAAPYALISSTTFYTRHGDWFATLCAIISVAVLAARFCAAAPRAQKFDVSDHRNTNSYLLSNAG